MVYLGIDPGISGALAFYDKTSHRLEVFDMPVFETRTEKRVVDGIEVAKMIRRYEIRIALIESVGAMTYTNAFGEKRGQGAAQSFAFGRSFGVVIGVLGALGVKTEYIFPAVWKNLMGLSSDKTISLDRARSLFSKGEEVFRRKKDNDKAEAALLAYFASQRF